MVDTGLNAIRNLMSSGGGTPPSHLEIGSSTITPAAGDTALTGSYLRKAWDTNTVDDKKNKYEVTFTTTEANGTIIRGAGVFNATTLGDMYSEVSVADLEKDADRDIQFNVEISYADA